jgi:hypothetical protein
VTIGRDQAPAKSFTKLFERTGWTHGKLAEREGRSPAWVTLRGIFPTNHSDSHSPSGAGIKMAASQHPGQSNP